MLTCQSSPPSPSTTITSSVNSVASSESSTFGDLLANLLHSLPKEASLELLKSLRGLSSNESQELCEYLHVLKPQKQFRVITAMANSQLEGKQKFLKSLGDKVSIHQRACQENRIAESDRGHHDEMVFRMKQNQVEKAASRVKIMNHGNKNFHSFNAIFPNYSDPAKNGDAAQLSEQKQTKKWYDEMRRASKDNKSVTRSQSSSSVTRIVTPADLVQMNQMLHSTTLEDPEKRLRELEKDTVLQSKTPDSENQEQQHDNAKAPDERKRFQKFRQGFRMQQSQKSHSQQSIHFSSHHKSSNMFEMSKTRNVTRTVKTYRTFKSVSTTYTKSNSSKTSASSVPSTEPVDDTLGTSEYFDSDAPKAAKWTTQQDDALRYSVQLYNERNWKAIAELVPNRNHAQCLQRWRKVLKPGLVKGHWSYGEDQILEALIYRGYNNWTVIAEQIPGRTPKQCRERWKNHLNPMINKGPYTEEEDRILLHAQYQMGNKWSQIAQMLPGRTEDSVKIRFKSLQQNPQKAIQSYAQVAQIKQEKMAIIAPEPPLQNVFRPNFTVSVSAPSRSDLIQTNSGAKHSQPPLPPHSIDERNNGQEDMVTNPRDVIIRPDASLDPYIYQGHSSLPQYEAPYVALIPLVSSGVDTPKMNDTLPKEREKINPMLSVSVESAKTAPISQSIGFSNTDQEFCTFTQPTNSTECSANDRATTQCPKVEQANLSSTTIDDEDEAIFNQLAQELEQETLDFGSILS